MPDNRESKSDTGHLNRRNFLRTGLTGGIAVAAFPALAGTSPLPPPSPEVKSFDLDEMTIAELQKGMSTGKYTARSITQKYLTRIAATPFLGLEGLFLAKAEVTEEAGENEKEDHG